MTELFGCEGGPCRTGRWRNGHVIAGLGGCEPATVLVREACIHEHIFDVWLCESCAGSDRPSHCAFCITADPGSHVCKLARHRLEMSRG